MLRTPNFVRSVPLNVRPNQRDMVGRPARSAVPVSYACIKVLVRTGPTAAPGAGCCLYSVSCGTVRNIQSGR